MVEYSLILVEVTTNSRTITVKGKRGTLTKAFKHLKVELVPITEKNSAGKTVRYIEINSYLTTYKQSAVLFTMASHIKNMIKGVTKGFRYKMHIVKKHFPIDVKINKESIQIGRFLGERNVKVVKLLDGVSCSRNEKNGEEFWFDGNDIEKVALTCI